MKKHFKLFEEFNPYTGRELAEQMRIFALGSATAKKVSSIRQEEDFFVFTIHTSQLGENGKIDYKIFVPYSQMAKAKVATYEKGKEVFTAGIEIRGENDLHVILLNYIEAANLYDDSVIEQLVDHHQDIHSASDIKRIIKTLVVANK